MNMNFFITVNKHFESITLWCHWFNVKTIQWKHLEMTIEIVLCCVSTYFMPSVQLAHFSTLSHSMCYLIAHLHAMTLLYRATQHLLSDFYMARVFFLFFLYFLFLKPKKYTIFRFIGFFYRLDDFPYFPGLWRKFESVKNGTCNWLVFFSLVIE